MYINGKKVKDELTGNWRREFIEKFTKELQKSPYSYSLKEANDIAMKRADNERNGRFDNVDAMVRHNLSNTLTKAQYEKEYNDSNVKDDMQINEKDKEFFQKVMPQLVATFVKHYKREPTEQEIAELRKLGSIGTGMAKAFRTMLGKDSIKDDIKIEFIGVMFEFVEGHHPNIDRNMNKVFSLNEINKILEQEDRVAYEQNSKHGGMYDKCAFYGIFKINGERYKVQLARRVDLGDGVKYGKQAITLTNEDIERTKRSILNNGRQYSGGLKRLDSMKKDSKFRDAISFYQKYNGHDIYKDENGELYLALTKSASKLGRLNTKDLSVAKKKIDERDSFLSDSKAKDSKVKDTNFSSRLKLYADTFYATDFKDGNDAKRWWVNEFKKASNMKSKELKEWAEDMLDYTKDISVPYIKEDTTNLLKDIVKGKVTDSLKTFKVNGKVVKAQDEFDAIKKVRDDNIEGVYQCKNDEVIEVRFDSKYSKYRVSFQKGGSPVVLDKSNTEKLIRSYNGYKIQDSKKVKDSKYEYSELMKMFTGQKYGGWDIFKENGKYCVNPNVSDERYDTLEELKKRIDKNFRDSKVKDAYDIREGAIFKVDATDKYNGAKYIKLEKAYNDGTFLVSYLSYDLDYNANNHIRQYYQEMKNKNDIMNMLKRFNYRQVNSFNDSKKKDEKPKEVTINIDKLKTNENGDVKFTKRQFSGPSIEQVIEKKPSQNYDGKFVALCKMKNSSMPYMVAENYGNDKQIPNQKQWYPNVSSAKKAYKETK